MVPIDWSDAGTLCCVFSCLIRIFTTDNMLLSTVWCMELKTHPLQEWFLIALFLIWWIWWWNLSIRTSIQYPNSLWVSYNLYTAHHGCFCKSFCIVLGAPFCCYVLYFCFLVPFWYAFPFFLCTFLWNIRRYTSWCQVMRISMFMSHKMIYLIEVKTYFQWSSYSSCWCNPRKKT